MRDQPTPGQEGSPEAVSVLLLLHQRGEAGATKRELCELLGLTAGAYDAVIAGLTARERVACVGKGTLATWRIARP